MIKYTIWRRQPRKIWINSNNGNSKMGGEVECEWVEIKSKKMKIENTKSKDKTKYRNVKKEKMKRKRKRCKEWIQKKKRKNQK